ncbi:NAD-dependent epimerase/dehydratase family protein [Clostridium intestinale]|uniref:NAD-dependent epimerase/dehydratase family protein n=1 Tax=Clostridium intestinale TaxID=36845 RepID=UPI0028EAED9D|nr:NAD-dependent epimerase/dehydratase family protein [Clostridium intestinale]
MIENKRIFLTGGAGFIGTKLSGLLSDRNEILIYDNLNRNSIKNTNLLNKSNISFVRGDILNFECLKSTIEEFKPDIVIHLAAIAGIETVIKNPVNTMKVNMIGTYNILEIIKDYKIDRFIDFSTSEVFGTYAYKVEETNTTNLAPVGEARWTYSVSKLAGEHLAHSYYKEYGVPVVTVRPFNIYGPGQVGEGAIHQFVKRAINDETIEIHGDGEQIRSWCYIEDFVDGIMLCLEEDDAIGNSFNIGNPQGTVTILMLAQLIKAVANSKSEIFHVPKTYVDVELRIPNIDKARAKLNYNPKYDLTNGIKLTIDWYRESLNSNE